MLDKKPPLVFTVGKKIVDWVYPDIRTVGELPDGPVVYVANHCQLNGPLCCELHLPGENYLWGAGAMFTLKEVPEYAFTDFWSFKPKWTHPWFKLCSYLIAPLSVLIFNYCHTIPVYRDARIISTFKQSLDRLTAGASVVIFPEQNIKHNHIVYDFQDKFIDLARLYYKKTGQALRFVPLYIAPKLRQMTLGDPVDFDPAAPIGEERARIKTYLMAEITRVAESLPLHTVVPYRNIPKKLYPKNRP